MNNQKDEIRNQVTEAEIRNADDGLAIRRLLEVIFRELAELRRGVKHLHHSTATVCPHPSPRDTLSHPMGEGNRPTVEPPNESEAARVFAVMARMDAQPDQELPTPFTVFRLTFKDGLSATRVAAECNCSRATVMRRLRHIRHATGLSTGHFRALSGHLLQMMEDYQSTGAREIYRRALANEGD